MVQLIINIVITFSIYFIVAFSFSFIYNTLGIFHIAHAAIITFGAYFVYLFSVLHSMSMMLSISLSIILTIAIGVSCELLIFKKMRDKQRPNLSFLITSLGLYIVFENLISIIFYDDTKIIDKSSVSIGYSIYNGYITMTQITTVFISFLTLIFGVFFYKYSKLGKKMLAVSSNNNLGEVFGINKNRVTLWAFIIGSGFASIIGILIAYDTGMTPTMGFNFLIFGIVALIIGGRSSIWGIAVGSLLLATAQHLSSFYINSKWMESVAYIILVIFLIWKPYGFSGKQSKKVII